MVFQTASSPFATGPVPPSAQRRPWHILNFFPDPHGQGAFLAGTSFWVPLLGPGLVTFDLAVSGLPAGWDAVSQGRRTAHERTVSGTSVSWSSVSRTGSWSSRGRLTMAPGGRKSPTS